MNSDSSFKILYPNAKRVPVIFDGTTYQLPAGMNLAAALLSAGIRCFRVTAAKQSPRGPYCMMGTCYDCLVEIDAVTQQACMTKVTDGLVVNPVRIPEPDNHE